MYEPSARDVRALCRALCDPLQGARTAAPVCRRSLQRGRAGRRRGRLPTARSERRGFESALSLSPKARERGNSRSCAQLPSPPPFTRLGITKDCLSLAVSLSPSLSLSLSLPSPSPFWASRKTGSHTSRQSRCAGSCPSHSSAVSESRFGSIRVTIRPYPSHNWFLSESRFGRVRVTIRPYPSHDSAVSGSRFGRVRVTATHWHDSSVTESVRVIRATSAVLD